MGWGKQSEQPRQLESDRHATEEPRKSCHGPASIVLNTAHAMPHQPPLSRHSALWRIASSITSDVSRSKPQLRPLAASGLCLQHDGQHACQLHSSTRWWVVKHWECDSSFLSRTLLQHQTVPARAAAVQPRNLDQSTQAQAIAFAYQLVQHKPGQA